MGISRN